MFGKKGHVVPQTSQNRGKKQQTANKREASFHMDTGR